MRPGWDEEIARAQECSDVPIQTPEGWAWFARVPYGREGPPWTAEKPCHDCAVVAGQFHVFGCDVERCPRCQQQMLSCDCIYLEELPAEPPQRL